MYRIKLRYKRKQMGDDEREMDDNGRKKAEEEKWEARERWKWLGPDGNWL